MTDKEFIKTVQEYIRTGNCNISKDREILLAYKKDGGMQDIVKKLLEDLSSELSDDTILQDRAYDILDIVTGWCSGEVRVWK